MSIGVDKETDRLHLSLEGLHLLYCLIKLRWGLLADRYGLPIRGYWQTVWSANYRLLADRVQNIQTVCQ